jgi:hypothetical protein
VAHVIESVADLLGRERSVAPLRAGLRLGELDAEKLTDQAGVPQRVRETDQPGGDLEVEEVARGPAGPEAAQAHFFPAGVDHDLVGGIDD